MKIFVCGAGVVGYGIAQYLINEGHDITVVDNDPVLIAKINDTLDCRGFVGHASSPAVLAKAGINNTDMLVAVTRQDEVNMLACYMANAHFDVPNKIARIRNQSYLESQWSGVFNPDGLPIDTIISPEKEVAETIIRRFKLPGVVDVKPIVNGEWSLVVMKVKDSAPVKGVDIPKIYANYTDIQFGFVSILRMGKVIPLTASTILESNDEVYLVSKTEHLQYVVSLFGLEADVQQKIVVVGGGNVGWHIAKHFEDNNNVSVRIIENNSSVARKLAEKLPSTTIINGDALNINVLEESNIHQYDTCISVTNDDETNLLTGLLAKKAGVNRCMALINNTGYSSLSDTLGVDVMINPKDITIAMIIENIRYKNIHSMYLLPDEETEILEISVEEGSIATEVPVAQLGLPKGSYLGAIIRQDAFFIPLDKTICQSGDVLLVLIKSKNVEEVSRKFFASELNI